MSASQTVKSFTSAVEWKDFDQASACLSEDFVCMGATPQPLTKNQFLALMAALQLAMPDLSYNLKGVEEVGEKVKATMQIVGTQSANFVLPLPGMNPVPATGKEITLPEQGMEYTFKGDQIAGIALEQVPGGGISGLLAQMGVQQAPPQE